MGSERDDRAREPRPGTPAPDVLSAAGVGVWRLECPASLVSLDMRASSLLGLSGFPAVLHSDQLAVCLPKADLSRLRAAIRLSERQKRPVDVRVDAVDAEGRPLRVLRVRLGVIAEEPHTLGGTVTEENWADAVDEHARGGGGGDREGRDGGPSGGRELRQVEALNRPASRAGSRAETRSETRAGDRAGDESRPEAPPRTGAGRPAGEGTGRRSPAEEAASGPPAPAPAGAPEPANHPSTSTSNSTGTGAAPGATPADRATPHHPRTPGAFAHLDAPAAGPAAPETTPPDTATPPPPDTAPGTRAARLLEAGRALAEAEGTVEVLRAVASLSAPGFALDRQLIYRVENGHLVVAAHYGYEDPDVSAFRMTLDTRYPGAEAIRDGRPVWIPDAEDYQRRYPAMWPLVAPYNRQAWAYLPLVSGGRTTGAWMASFRAPVDFGPDERAVLTTLARMVAHALERTETHDTDRALAHGLQRSMQPRTYGVPGLAVAARYVPTGGGLLVGGDWVDVADLPDGRISVVIGDVEGHDVHAASIMVQLRTAVRAYTIEGHRPDAVLARASRFLTRLDEDRYATCIHLVADPGTGVLEVARAGHPHPVLRLPDGTTLLRHIDGGLPLGMSELGEEDYPVNRIQLQTGEIFLLCTDGLIENAGHDYYSGWLRCREALSPEPVDDLEAVADRLLNAVHGPDSHRAPGHLSDRREDDIALLLIRRDAPLAAGDRLRRRQRRSVMTVPQDRPERIGGARVELREVLYDWAIEDHVDATTLLATELLANVLVHTESEAVMEVYLTGEHGARTVHVEVYDHSDELPHRRTPGEMASSGRGLVLLEMLAHRWGVNPRGHGKSIWFEMDENRSQSPPDPMAAMSFDE